MRPILPLVIALISVAACSNHRRHEEQSAAAAGTSTAKAHTAHSPHKHEAPSGTAAPHADHNARHGGVVTMEGDNHVEIVIGADGAIDLYVTDAVRIPIPLKDVSGTITIEPVDGKEKQTLTLTEDPGKGSLSAKGPPPTEKAEYTWKLKVRGGPMRMTLRVPAGGTAAFAKTSTDHAATGEHKHGSPHGGTVQSMGDGHVEVKLEKSGDVTVWMLDASERPRPASGVTATIRPVVAGAKEIKLDYDEKTDALRGKVGPVDQESVDAIVTVTPSGGTAASVRLKLKLEPTSRPGQ